MNQDEALTAEEVAKLLKVSRGTVYSLKDKGELPSFLVGRKLRFTRRAVQDYIERSQPGRENPAQAAPTTASTGKLRHLRPGHNPRRALQLHEPGRNFQPPLLRRKL